LTERDGMTRWRCFFRRLPVELKERYNVGSGWKFEKPLLKAHQKVIGLVELGFGLRFTDLTEGEAVTFAEVHELAVVAVSLPHQRSHRCEPLQIICNMWPCDPCLTAASSQQNHSIIGYKMKVY